MNLLHEPQAPHFTATVIGAGPAGLMAAEHLARHGAKVTIHDHMPSPGRKFLMAGRGGLNLTHSEPLDTVLARYRPQTEPLLSAIRDFSPDALIDWTHGLGIETFVGSSGRIFPTGLKASPLLRAWIGRLRSLGVEFRLRSRWEGWGPGNMPTFSDDTQASPSDVCVLALGGASWPRLGSDGSWTSLLDRLRLTPWAPSNMGFMVAWSDQFLARHEGTPLKRIALTFEGETVRGEALVTRSGIEGNAVYALSAQLRDAILARGTATVTIDLRPDFSAHQVRELLATRSRAESLSTSLRKAIGLPPVAVGLVQEALHGVARGSTPASLVKALPVPLIGIAPIGRAISSAGGIGWDEIDHRFMLKAYPGIFACGEMLDWEAPTGGYLLQGCFSTAKAAAAGALAWWAEQSQQ